MNLSVGFGVAPNKCNVIFADFWFSTNVTHADWANVCCSNSWMDFLNDENSCLSILIEYSRGFHCHMTWWMNFREGSVFGIMSWQYTIDFSELRAARLKSTSMNSICICINAHAKSIRIHQFGRCQLNFVHNFIHISPMAAIFQPNVCISAMPWEAMTV